MGIMVNSLLWVMQDFYHPTVVFGFFGQEARILLGSLTKSHDPLNPKPLNPYKPL